MNEAHNNHCPQKADDSKILWLEPEAHLHDDVSSYLNRLIYGEKGNGHNSAVNHKPNYPWKSEREIVKCP